MKFKPFLISLISLSFFSILATCSQESFISQTISKSQYPPPTLKKVVFDKSGTSVDLTINTYILDPRDFLYSGGVLLYQAYDSALLENVFQDEIKNYQDDFSKKPHFLALLKFSKLTTKTKFKKATPMQETSFKLNLPHNDRVFFRASAIGKSTLLGHLEDHLGFFETSPSKIFSLSQRFSSSVTISTTSKNGLQLNPKNPSPGTKGTDISLSLREISSKSQILRWAALIPSSGVLLQNVGFKKTEEITNLLSIPHINGFSDKPCPLSEGHLIFALKNNSFFALFVEGFSQEQLETLSNISLDEFSFSLKVITSQNPGSDNTI